MWPLTFDPELSFALIVECYLSLEKQYRAKSPCPLQLLLYSLHLILRQRR
jgi:hypothetical protein